MLHEFLQNFTAINKECGAYPSFCSLKRLARSVATPDPGWDARRIASYLPAVYSWVEKGTAIMKRLSQEHNTMTPAKA